LTTCTNSGRQERKKIQKKNGQGINPRPASDRWSAAAAAAGDPRSPAGRLDRASL
jgi:hypothetical protein